MPCRWPKRLVEGGLPVLEITLAHRKQRPTASAPSWRKSKDAIVGSGPCSTRDQLAAQSKSLVAPLPSRPGRRPLFSKPQPIMRSPLLPGAATASESMLLLEARLSLSEILSRRAVRVVPPISSSLASPLPQITLLPDRRHHTGERAGLSEACQCRHHWRLMDGAESDDCRQATGRVSPRSRGSAPSCGGSSSLAEL